MSVLYWPSGKQMHDNRDNLLITTVSQTFVQFSCLNQIKTKSTLYTNGACSNFEPFRTMEIIRTVIIRGFEMFKNP